MRTHLLSHAVIVLALASSPIMADDSDVTQDASSQPGAVQMTPEEAALLENMAAEEAAMAEQMTASEATAAEEMAAEESTATEEMAAEESTATEEMAAEESTATEEMAAEGSTATEEMATEERVETTGTVIDSSGPAAPIPNIDMPERGMHMKQVEQMYGKPLGINPPVGDPPITRWDYPGFAVYFEYSYVIQSVEKPAMAQ